MGVTGLWKLIDAAGKEVTLESLEGKAFAVDASILINQAIKGMKGQPNAHLHVLFLRICKLLTYKIKPIFVFDGSAPILKRQTLAARQKKRDEANTQAEELATQLKRKALQMHAVDEVLGKPTARKYPKISTSSDSDMFSLPPLPAATVIGDDVDDDYQELPIHQMLYTGDLDLREIDIESEGFKSLPAEYQHEILEELKEHNKHNKANLTRKDIECGSNFSTFQVQKILKTNKISYEIERLRKVMIENMTDSAGADSEGHVLNANRVLSEDATHFLLLKRDSSQPTSKSSQIINISADLETKKDRGRLHDINPNQTRQPIENRGTSEIQSTSLSTTTQLPRAGYTNTKVSNNVDYNNPCHKRTTSQDHISIGLDASSSTSHKELDTPKHTGKTPVAQGTRSKVHSRPTSPAPIDGDEQANQSNVVPSEGIMSAEGSGQKNSNRIPIQIESLQEHLKVPSDITIAPSLTRKSPHVVETVNLADQKAMTVRKSPVIEAIDKDTTNFQTQEDIAKKAPSEQSITINIQTDLKDKVDDIDLFPADMFVSNPTAKVPSPTKPKDQNPDKTETPHIDLTDILGEDNSNLSDTSHRLEKSQTQLYMQFEKRDAVSQAVTQPMIDDSIELLRLFGIPFVLSPSEAEAQCAKLEELGLCDGTITDDSDIWLFGGTFVLKNFFQHDKFVVAFAKKDIGSIYGLDRDKMIALALVCGSDYTDGIPGAGAVTAMEIISEFDAQDGLNALKAFRTWADTVRDNDYRLPASSSNTKVRSKLSKFVKGIPQSFPNHVVIEAYQKPRVDNSTEAFEWSRPDLDLLRDFAKRKLDWPTSKVDDLVCPVLKRMNSAETQAKLSKFFNVHAASVINTSSEFQSQRLKSAIDKLIGQNQKEVRSDKAKQEKPAVSSSKPEMKAVRKLPLTDRQPKGKQTKKLEKKTAKIKIKPAAMETRKSVRIIKDEVNLSEDSNSD